MHKSINRSIQHTSNLSRIALDDLKEEARPLRQLPTTTAERTAHGPAATDDLDDDDGIL